MKRRSFLKSVAAAGVAAYVHAAIYGPRSILGANEQLVLGVVGCSRGLSDAKDFMAQGARVAYVCDVDEERLGKAKEETQAENAVTDMRRIFEDKAVDAVIIATPDHWHVPAALLACEAGKHVYVEKPCSHNIREGRLLIETARRTNRVVQVGSQSRSTPFIRNGIQLLREGAIGDILVAKAWNSQRRADIGHQQPSDPPPGLDYDLWVGPAPMCPYQNNCLHYGWHWRYDFGTGDAGNDGVHELDIARWGLGVDRHPARVAGYGSKLFFDDDQQFPDTQYVTFEYPPAEGASKPRLLVYEHRIWSPYTQQGLENGNAFYGTNGYMILGKGGGWQVFGPKNELIKEEKNRFSMAEHVLDFMDAIRSNRLPNADIEIGHYSATLAHLANMVARTEHGSIQFDPASESVAGDDDANALVKRTYREGHWAVPKGV